eukprot:gene449-810_t
MESESFDFSDVRLELESMHEEEKNLDRIRQQLIAEQNTAHEQQIKDVLIKQLQERVIQLENKVSDGILIDLHQKKLDTEFMERCKEESLKDAGVIKSLRARIELLERERIDFQERINRSRSEIENFKTIIKVNQQLTSENKDFSSEISLLRNDLLISQEKNSSLKRSYAELDNERNELERNHSNQMNKIEDLQIQIQTMNCSMNILEQKYSSILKSNTDIEIQHKEDIQVKLDVISQYESKIQMDMNTINQKDTIITKLQDEKTQLQHESIKLQHELQDLHKNSLAISSETNIIILELNNKIKELENDSYDKDDLIIYYKDEINKKDKEIYESNYNKEKYEIIYQNITDRDIVILELTNELDKLKDNIVSITDQLKYSEQTRSIAYNTLQHAQDVEHQLRKEINDLNNSNLQRQDVEVQLRKEINDLNNFNLQLQDVEVQLNKEISELKNTNQHMQGVEVQLRKEILELNTDLENNTKITELIQEGLKLELAKEIQSIHDKYQSELMEITTKIKTFHYIREELMEERNHLKKISIQIRANLRAIILSLQNTSTSSTSTSTSTTISLNETKSIGQGHEQGPKLLPSPSPSSPTATAIVAGRCDEQPLKNHNPLYNQLVKGVTTVLHSHMITVSAIQLQSENLVKLGIVGASSSSFDPAQIIEELQKFIQHQQYEHENKMKILESNYEDDLEKLQINYKKHISDFKTFCDTVEESLERLEQDYIQRKCEDKVLYIKQMIETEKCDTNARNEEMENLKESLLEYENRLQDMSFSLKCTVGWIMQIQQRDRELIVQKRLLSQFNEGYHKVRQEMLTFANICIATENMKKDQDETSNNNNVTTAITSTTNTSSTTSTTLSTVSTACSQHTQPQSQRQTLQHLPTVRVLGIYLCAALRLLRIRRIVHKERICTRAHLSPYKEEARSQISLQLQSQSQSQSVKLQEWSQHWMESWEPPSRVLLQQQYGSVHTAGQAILDSIKQQQIQLKLQSASYIRKIEFDKDNNDNKDKEVDNNKKKEMKKNGGSNADNDDDNDWSCSLLLVIANACTVKNKLKLAAKKMTTTMMMKTITTDSNRRSNSTVRQTQSQSPSRSPTLVLSPRPSPRPLWFDAVESWDMFGISFVKVVQRSFMTMSQRIKSLRRDMHELQTAILLSEDKVIGNSIGKGIGKGIDGGGIDGHSLSIMNSREGKRNRSNSCDNNNNSNNTSTTSTTAIDKNISNEGTTTTATTATTTNNSRDEAIVIDNDVTRLSIELEVARIQQDMMMNSTYITPRTDLLSHIAADTEVTLSSNVTSTASDGKVLKTLSPNVISSPKMNWKDEYRQHKQEYVQRIQTSPSRMRRTSKSAKDIDDDSNSSYWERDMDSKSYVHSNNNSHSNNTITNNTNGYGYSHSSSSSNNANTSPIPTRIISSLSLSSYDKDIRRRKESVMESPPPLRAAAKDTDRRYDTSKISKKSSEYKRSEAKHSSKIQERTSYCIEDAIFAEVKSVLMNGLSESSRSR